MGPVIGDLLPLALGVAISPVPIIAVILMLLTPRAGGTSTGFLIGWVAGILVACTLFTLLAAGAGLSGSSSPSTVASWIKLLLGVALIALGVLQWRKRPAPGEEAKLPAWLAAIDKVTPARAAGLGFALAAVNPKNLAMAVAAGVAIGGTPLSTGSRVACVAIFTVLAALTVAVPVLGYAFAAERMRGPLNSLKGWLEANNATVMGVLLLVIGVVLLGKGLGALL